MGYFRRFGPKLGRGPGVSPDFKISTPPIFPSSNLIFDRQKNSDQTLLRRGPSMSTDVISIATSIFKVRSVPRIALGNFGVQYFFWPIGHPNGQVLSPR